MFIIVDGADKTGKSTLCSAIVEEFGSKYFHFGKPKKYPATEYAEYALSMNENMVLDRFYLGELVYGPLFRGKAGLTPLEFATIERILRLKQAIFVQTTTNATLANKRLLASVQDEMVNKEQNVKAVQAFKGLFGKSKVSHIIQYDGSTRENLAVVLSQLESLQNGVERNQAEIKNVCTGIGTPVGQKIVFVGEAVNHNVTWMNLPFDKGFSSQFLLDSFQAARVPEEQIYLCNADKITSKEVEFLSREKTTFVSLGKKADEKLNFLDVPHYALAHPQYVKRFLWNKKDEYVTELKLIVKEASK